MFCLSWSGSHPDWAILSAECMLVVRNGAPWGSDQKGIVLLDPTFTKASSLQLPVAPLITNTDTNSALKT
jgi:hypothetical protein